MKLEAVGRRQRAAVRQAERAARTPAQQLELVKYRPGYSERERARLEALCASS